MNISEFIAKFTTHPVLFIGTGISYNSPKILDNLQRLKIFLYFCRQILKVMGRPSKFDLAFKAKVAVEALQEKEPLAVLAKKYKVAPSVITSWKEELLHNSSKAFESDAADKREVKQLKQQNERLMRKVGQLTLECDFFAQACEDAGLKVR